MPTDLNQKIYVAGHRGMVGSAIVRELQSQGYTNFVLRNHDQLDLTNQAAVKAFFDQEKPAQVYLAAAKVGGIHANNSFPADFIYSNLMIQSNVIHQAFMGGVKKLLLLGSSCIYPKLAPQPISEESLLTGTLEPTNEPYAIAKIAGIKMCESYNRQFSFSHGLDYRSIMPTNLYGPGDNYHSQNSHVIPALLRRFHEAKYTEAPSVTIWGTGNARREFLYVDDLAAAATFIMNLSETFYQEKTKPMQSHINVGSGMDISISKLAKLIADVVGYNGKIIYDNAKPDGTPRKLMNSSLINSWGWSSKTNLFNGLKIAYEDMKCRAEQ